ncbi:unnamed protein product [Heterosigma akashiwo]
MASSIPWWKKKYSGVKGQHIMQAAVGVSMGIVFVAVPSMINMITDYKNNTRKILNQPSATADYIQQRVYEGRLKIREEQRKKATALALSLKQEGGGA